MSDEIPLSDNFGPDPATVSLQKVREERTKAEGLIRDALNAFWKATGIQPQRVELHGTREEYSFAEPGVLVMQVTSVHIPLTL